MPPSTGAPPAGRVRGAARYRRWRIPRVDGRDAGRSHPRRPEQWHESGREVQEVKFFSDAVFAIAITLLALQLTVPVVHQPIEHELPRAVVQLWPRVLTYATSFLLVGGFWMSYHRQMHFIRRCNARFLLLNLLLMSIAFLPFPTAVLGAYGMYTFTFVFYAASIGLAGLLSTALWLYATGRAGLAPEVERRFRWQYALRSVSPAVDFGLAIPVAFWNPTAAVYTWLAIFIGRRAVFWFLGWPA